MKNVSRFGEDEANGNSEIVVTTMASVADEYSDLHVNKP